MYNRVIEYRVGRVFVDSYIRMTEKIKKLGGIKEMIRLLKNFRLNENTDVCRSDNEPYIVYKLSEDGEGYELYEPYDESNVSVDKYDDGDYVAIPMSATGYNVVNFHKGDIIKNICGSTGDLPPRGQGSAWIRVLRNQNCTVNGCCTDGKFYDERTGSVLLDSPCNHDLVGGHIVIGRNADPNVRRNGTAYMLAICKNHNTSHIGKNGPGLGYYMIVGRECRGLELIGYQPRVFVEDAIRAEASAEAAAAADENR